jgi:hypothetical protein
MHALTFFNLYSLCFRTYVFKIAKHYIFKKNRKVVFSKNDINLFKKISWCLINYVLMNYFVLRARSGGWELYFLYIKRNDPSLSIS